MSVKEKQLIEIPQDDYLSDFETCEQLVEQARDSHEIYWRLIDVCEHHIRGKKPKDPDKLKKAGISWANNWNYNKARSKISRTTLTNIDLAKSALQLAVPEFKRSGDLDFLGKDEDRAQISMKISRVFYDSIEKESTAESWFNQIEYPSTAFGYTAIIFNDDEDWMGDPIHPRNIAFEDHTEPDNIRAFVVFKLMKAGDLWKKWTAANAAVIRETVDEENPTTISTTNWSANGLEALLWNAMSDMIKWSESNQRGVKDWEQVMDQITSRERSIQYFIRNTNNVKIAKIFYKELSGKWTETYIPFENDWQTHGKGSDATGDMIIFKKHHGKKSQDAMLVLVKDSSFMEGNYVHELRGLAKYAVEDSVRFNRKKNNIEDKLTFSGSPMFEQKNTQQKDAFKITPTAGFTLVRQGFDMIPNQPTFDLTNHLLSIEMDEKHFLRETEHFDSRLEGKLTSRPVKDEVIQKSKEVQDVRSSKNAVKFADYSSLAFQLLQNLRRVNQPQEGEIGYRGYTYFYEELEYELRDYIDGDPKQFIKKVIDHVVSFTVEPVLSDAEAIQLALAMAETSFARNRLKRMLLMVNGFPRKEIDRIAPLPADTFRNLRDEWKARVENDMFWTSNDALVTPEDDHIDHLNEHFKKFQTTVQGIQQGRVDIINGFKYLANLSSHSEQHLALMSQDPTMRNAYEQLQDTHNQFVKVLGQIKSEAEQEFKNREKQAQQSIPPEKLKELQLMEFDKVQKNKRAAEQHQLKAQLKMNEQQFKQAMEAQQQQFDQALERSKAEAERELNTIREAASLLS